MQSNPSINIKAIKGADLFIKCLKEEGVEYVFGLPGEENLHLLEAIRNSGIKFILTRHEQAAAFMAATYGRLTGKAGVVLATLGPGATNLVTGVAYAQLGGYPVVVITGQRAIKGNLQGEFQIVSVVAMMEPITKMARQIVSADRIPSMVREAFKLSEEERPGAVHLELPEDIALEKSSSVPLKRFKIRRPAPDPKAVKTAVKMIEESKHPLIMIAAGANRNLVSKQLGRFIARTSIPFFTTQMGKGVIDERDNHYIGTTVLIENDFIHRAIDKSDLIISIGHDITEKPPAILGYGGKKTLHINFYSTKIDDVYFPAYEVIGDISHTLWQFTEKITKQPHWNFEYFKKIASEIKGIKISSAGFPLSPQRLTADLRKIVPEDGIIALDNGLYKLWIARDYPAYRQNTVLLDNALGSMGAGLPSAIVAKLVHPDRSVVSVCGDGGFMMNSQELETAIRLGMDIVVVILRDNGFGMVKWKQKVFGFKDFGLDFGNPDFVKYAECYGAKGYQVKSTADFSRILNNCIGRKGVHVIDCSINYSERIDLLPEMSGTGKSFIP